MSGPNNPFFGKKHTAETKEKMRKNHVFSEEAKAKLSSICRERTKNLKWVNNGSEQKRIKKEKVNFYLEKGWKLGRLPCLKISQSLKKYYEEHPERKYWGANINKNGRA